MDIDAIINADGNLYQTWIPDHDLTFTYRLLTLREFKVFRGLRDSGVLSPDQAADQAFERCYTGNLEFISDNIPAGIIISLGTLILYLSGDCDSDTLQADITLSRQLHPMDTVFEYMRSVIVTAFPAYNLEDIEAFSRQQFIRHFTIAENVLAKQNPEYSFLDLSEIKSSEQMALEQQQKQNAPPIDFRKENAQIRKAMGPFDEEEARAGKLDRGQLRKLSAARRG